MRKISDVGVNLIKSFEGCKLTSWRDVDGIWTIGHGSVRGVYPGMVITREQAEQMLRAEILNDESYIQAVVTKPINQPMFDALLSFVYNIGQGNF